VLYDSPNPVERGPIAREDLMDLPLNQENQENQEEIRIFNEAGFEVPRWNPNFRVGTIPFGALIDFKRIQEMFQAPRDDDDDHSGTRKAGFQVYPQAGLLSCGHVVAQGLMFPFTDYLARLNRWLGRNEEEQEDDNMEDEDWKRNDEPAVRGIASQMYNSIMHNTRGNSSQQHGVVSGNVTAALAGYWTQNTPHATKAANFALKCDNQLPHEEYLAKIINRPLSRDLRVENVFSITMSAVHPSKRAGR
jgi:hypothetical protein